MEDVGGHWEEDDVSKFGAGGAHWSNGREGEIGKGLFEGRNKDGGRIIPSGGWKGTREEGSKRGREGSRGPASKGSWDMGSSTSIGRAGGPVPQGGGKEEVGGIGGPGLLSTSPQERSDKPRPDGGVGDTGGSKMDSRAKGLEKEI